MYVFDMYYSMLQQHLLVERLGVRGGASNVGIAGSLVRASGELELVGGLEVRIAGLFVHRVVGFEIKSSLRKERT